MLENHQSIIKKMLLRDFNISEDQYIKSCLAFARDTQSWIIIDSDFYYIPTHSPDSKHPDWVSTDNEEYKAFDLAWVFNLDIETIESKASVKYNKLIENLFQQAVNNYWYDKYSYVSSCVNLKNKDSVLIDFIGEDEYAKLEKYPADPLASTFFINLIEAEKNNPNCDWQKFQWDLFSNPTTIFENDLGYWESIEYDN